MLVDAANLYFRAFYALPESITAPDGRPVNAVRGYLDMTAALIVPFQVRTSIVPSSWRVVEHSTRTVAPSPSTV